MQDSLVETASKLAYKDVTERRKRKDLPKPRSLTQVSKERLSERALEAMAPKTGYPELDYILKGFIPGRLYTMTGDENVGKTSLACNFAVRVSKQGYKVLYFALEPENTVVDYIASVRFDRKFNDLMQSDLTFDDGNIFVYGKEEVRTIDDMVDIVTHIKEKYSLIIIDHIGYFTSGSTNNFNQTQSDAIKKLAALSKKKQTPIIMIAHLRKRANGQKKSRVPTSDDISGSGAFKQDSTDVMIVVRDLMDPDGDGLEYANTGTLYVTKTKSGPNGHMQINFHDGKANITSNLTMGETVKDVDDVMKWLV